MPAIFLSWTSSPGATSYEVIRDDGQHTNVALANSWSDTNVTVGGTAYTYFVRASDSTGTTDSKSVSVAPPPTQCSPPPAPFTITGQALCYPGDATHSMAPAEQLDWHSALYATSYQMFKNDAAYHLPIASGASLYTFIGFPINGGVTNSYYVVAKNAAGTTNSNPVTFTVPADICVTSPPVSVLSGSTACNPQTQQPGASLRWTSVPAAFGWQLYRDGAPYVVPRSGLSYFDANVVAGHTYTYNIATNGLNAPLSNPITVTVSDAVCLPGTVGVTATPFCNGATPVVRLIWNAADNGATYTVLRGGATIADRLQGTSFDDLSPVSGATYLYQVVATNRAGSTPSLPVRVTVNDQLCPPASFSSSAVTVCSGATPSVLLTWSKSAGAVSYEISRNGVALGVALPPSAGDYVDAAPLGFYSYTITAKNAAGSAFSNTNGFANAAACTSPPGTFTASTVPACRNGQPAVRVQWQAASGATSYAVLRNGVTVSTSSAPATTYEDAFVSEGQTYNYRVIASNGTSSSTASAGSITPSSVACSPSAFTLTAYATCNPIVSPPQSMVTLNWSAAAAATSHVILRNGAQVASVSGSTNTFNDGAGAGTFTYVVRAVTPADSTDSNAVTVTVQPNLCSTPRPDLAASDISTPAVTPRPGDTFDVAVTISNAGDAAAAPATTSRIRIGSGATVSPLDPIVATIATPPLATGASTTQTATVTIPNLPAGTYYLFLSVDDDHVAGDINPANDVKRSAALTAQSPPCTLACAANVPLISQDGRPVAFALQRPPCVNDRALWTFGDSTSSTSYSPAHAYVTRGTYHWTLTLTATTGASCSTSGNITVTEPALPAKRRAVHH